MDINEIKDIVINSQLTDEAKSLIIALLPYAGEERVKSQILEILDLEVKLNQLAADQAEEATKILEDAAKQIEEVDDEADKDVEALMEETNKKLDEVKARIDAASVE